MAPWTAPFAFRHYLQCALFPTCASSVSGAARPAINSVATTGVKKRQAKLRDCPEHQDLGLGGANPEALQEGIVLTRQHYSDQPTGLGLQVFPESALSWESV